MQSKFRRNYLSINQRGPLRVLFANTSLPIGGAESLQLQLVRHLDRQRFTPLVCCLKEEGAIGSTLAEEVPLYSHLIGHKFDLGVVERLTRIMRREAIDALITVGAGDKMFWGRLAAKRARVPVILSAIHSTGWPDVIGRMNRMLTPITDAFVAVASSHGDYLVERERFPARKVVVIPNGVDTLNFQYLADERSRVRVELGIPSGVPCIGLVAALRPEKDHGLFLETAQRIVKQFPDCHFLLVGEGPERPRIEQVRRDLGLEGQVHLTGARNDVSSCLSAMDGFLLTSQMEASPVSILEAMAVGRPVVATDVGSIGEAITDGENGFLAPVGDAERLAESCCRWLVDSELAKRIGRSGRDWVEKHGSLRSMVAGYEELITRIYQGKQTGQPWRDPGAMIQLPTAGFVPAEFQ